MGALVAKVFNVLSTSCKHQCIGSSLRASPTPILKPPATIWTARSIRVLPSNVILHRSTGWYGRYFSRKSETKWGRVAGVRTVATPARTVLAQQKNHPPLPRFPSNAPRHIHAGRENAADGIEARDLAGWEGGADGCNLSGVAASMRTQVPEEPTPAAALH